MNYIKSKTYNARVFYVETAPPFIEAFEYIGTIDYHIENSPNLKFSNNNIYFYFFYPSSETYFFEEDFWVAKEVIGFENINEDSEFEMFDLEQGELFSVPVELDLERPENFNKICQYEKYFRDEISKEYSLAPTWRIKMDWGDDFNYRVTIEFFPSSEEAND